MKNRNIKALIADDEAHMRTFVKLILMDLGIKDIYLMQNGMDAIDAFREYEPDLVMLDINMNVMNGMDALEGIRKIDPNAAVVMMTAVASRNTVEESSKKGALYYILKTQPAEQIKEQLKEVIQYLTAAA